MQEVLQADWHEFAHSLHPGLHKLFLMLVLFIVFMCFMSNPPFYKYNIGNYSIVCHGNKVFLSIPSILLPNHLIFILLLHCFIPTIVINNYFYFLYYVNFNIDKKLQSTLKHKY